MNNEKALEYLKAIGYDEVTAKEMLSGVGREFYLRQLQSMESGIKEFTSENIDVTEFLNKSNGHPSTPNTGRRNR